MTAVTNPVLVASSSLPDVEGLHCLDPLDDSRWPRLVDRHPHGSVFHSRPWLAALRATYGYTPVVFTWSAPSEELQDGLVFCEVNSWLTGRRIVSLPFSDYCDPLLADAQNATALLSALQEKTIGSSWRYIEIRPLESLGASAVPGWRTCANYHFHRLDLRPALSTLFRNFHYNSIQRKIRRAERERLAYREGSSEELLDVFYPLLVATRKRHFIPPQPRRWFVNLMDSFGEALKVRLAYKGDRAIAGMITIRHKDTLYYKNGGSDARFHNLGGMHLLYWNAIQDAKEQGLNTLDFGRSDAGQSGLVTFKNRWGAACSSLSYYRFPPTGNSVHAFEPAGGMKMRAIKGFCSIAPACVLPAFGNLLYKHIG